MDSRTPPEPVAYDSSCVAYNLRRSSLAVNRIYAREMAGAPVRGPLFSLMMTIRRRGSSTITELASELSLDRTTLTRNLQPLERKGWIVIAPSGANRKLVSISPKGEQAISKSLQRWERAQSIVIEQLGEARWKRMRADLQAVMALN